uniref:Phytosulfokine n=1 Tax=Kalanchoe fedtschenkoi TaxID=63787 RepID=A0A7N1A3A5_KALFE
MAKLSSLFIFIAALLLISAAITSATRPLHEDSAVEVLSEEVGCEGLGAEECLEKTASNAHTDYIYTQGHPPQSP